MFTPLFGFKMIRSYVYTKQLKHTIMKVKELIEMLSKVDENLNVYLSDNNLDEDTFFYKALDVRELNVEDENIVSILYRN